MILSFSVPTMRPMIEAGLREMRGATVGERVKRQTIRARGPRADRLLADDPAGHTIPYDLHLWWKSRTPDRQYLGRAPAELVRVYPIEIENYTVEGTEVSRQLLKMSGPDGWRRGDSIVFWSPHDGVGSLLEAEARADGFDSVEAFRDFFVPRPGDRFSGILYRW